MAADGGDLARSSQSEEAAATAAAPYTRPFLAAYDLWVIRLSNRFAWRCDARIMLRMYQEHVGRRHLEVGPGSGWYLANTALPSGTEIVLMDLSSTPLEYVSARLKTAGDEVVRTAQGNVLKPVPASAGNEFDSVGINFVLHCVPGPLNEKGALAFTHLAEVLADDGVLFGSTILNTTPHTIFGRALTRVYGRIGAFNNSGDDREGLEAALRSAFRTFAIAQVGDVALFVARRPRR